MYELFADMSIDIDPAAAAKFDIKFIPMEYMIGEETRIANGPESREDMHSYYDRLRNKIPTKTSQITPYHYVEAFAPYVKEQKEILYLCLSSGLSKTYECAQLAVLQLKEEYGEDAVKIEVVDSLGATGGMGIQAEAAGMLREAGVSLHANAEWLRANAKRIRYWFKVEDLMYLSRGGRISGAAAMIGTALNLKPILTVNGEGKLDTIAKKRGSKMAMRYLIDCYKETMAVNFKAVPGAEISDDLKKAIGNLVYLCCSDCYDDAEVLKQMVLEVNPEAVIRITSLSPIIGAHTGPDMLSIVHVGSEK